MARGTTQSEAAARPGPGRPSTGADERILEAALGVLKGDGYAGLTTAKVAARSGQNKALISYHFGSKQGLVAAVARRVADEITQELVGRLGSPRTTAELVEGLVEGLWRVLDRDEGLARVYFDLASQSVVEPRVREIMHERKEGHRRVLERLLAGVDGGPAPEDAEAAVVYLVSGLEGLALAWLEHGDVEVLERAREMFVRAAPAAIG